jgi:hypothetical protein
MGIHPSPEFLEETELTKKPKNLGGVHDCTELFHSILPEALLARDRADRSAQVPRLSARKEEEEAPRSVYNKFENVMTFLKANGIRGLVGKNDWPRYTEEEPEMYEEMDLGKLFKACDAEERLLESFRLHSVRACYAQMRQRSRPAVPDDAAVVENFLALTEGQ